jgi:hypothetical protein
MEVPVTVTEYCACGPGSKSAPTSVTHKELGGTDLFGKSLTRPQSFALFSPQNWISAGVALLSLSAFDELFLLLLLPLLLLLSLFETLWSSACHYSSFPD